MYERELETEQRLQHIDPHSIGHNRISFPFSWAAQPGTWGPGDPASWGAGFLYRILSLTRLIPNCSVGGLRAPSAGCWLSLPHLVINWSGLQSNWLPVFTELYNSSTPTFLWTSQSHLLTRPVIFWYSLSGCTCYLHRCICYFDSPAGS